MTMFLALLPLELFAPLQVVLRLDPLVQDPPIEVPLYEVPQYVVALVLEPPVVMAPPNFYSLLR